MTLFMSACVSARLSSPLNLSSADDNAIFRPSIPPWVLSRYERYASVPTAAPSKRPGMMPLIVDMFPTERQVAVIASGHDCLTASTSFTFAATVGGGVLPPVDVVGWLVQAPATRASTSARTNGIAAPYLGPRLRSGPGIGIFMVSNSCRGGLAAYATDPGVQEPAGTASLASEIRRPIGEGTGYRGVGSIHAMVHPDPSSRLLGDKRVARPQDGLVPLSDSRNHGTSHGDHPICSPPVYPRWRRIPRRGFQLRRAAPAALVGQPPGRTEGADPLAPEALRRTC